jgi:hypothetical protein
MMNPWDNDAPWINSLRISKEAKQALWTQVQAGNVTENEAESYNWALLGDIANFFKAVATARVNGVPVGEVQKAQTDLETIRKRIATANEEITALEKGLSASRTDNIKVGRRTLTRQKATEDIEELRGIRKSLDDSLRRLSLRVRITTEDLQAQQDYADSWWQRYERTKNPEDFKQWQAASNAVETTIVSSVNRPGPNVRVGVGSVARRGMTAGQATQTEAMRTEAFAGRVPTTTPAGDTGGAGGGGAAAAAPMKVTRAEVTAGLTSAGLADTPGNRARVRADLEAKKGVGPQASWEELVAEQAGEYAYLLDPKYEGVPELLRTAVENKWFSSTEGQALFLREFKKTPYALNTNKIQQAFDVKSPGEKKLAIQKAINDIRTEYGEIQFDQTALEEVATTAARNGSAGVDLGRLVYRAAFKRGAASPVFTAPTAAKTALGGADADRIRAIYRAYGQRPDDEQISRILAQDTDSASGVVMTEDMLRNNLRDLAKVSYKPFADLLDRGVSVETIFSPYQRIAASVLEKAPDQVALIDENGVPTKFASALMSKEPMSLTDWITALKSDDKYGWQFTNEAKQQASNLVMSLEKAFGYRA